MITYITYLSQHFFVTFCWSNIVWTAPLLLGGGTVECPTKFSKRGGLAGPQSLEWGCWERGGDFFQGRGCNFHKKKELKAEIFNGKKKLQAKIFFCHN